LPLSRVVQEALSLVGDNSYYTGPKEISGAVVISDPRTGEILSMVSTPSFDPNSFTKNDEETIFAFLNDTVKMPMMNRAIAGIYPPGSTFKIITTTAGLEEGKITAQTKIEDVGSFSIGEFSFPNWYFIQYGKKEGMLDVIGAIRRSNDIFFYKTAEMLGIENLERWMKKFNLGIPLGIDIPGEGRGIVPSDAWKKENFGEGWYLGDTYHLGIGQGYLLVTPIQVDAWTGVIANGGKLCKPHLKQIQNSKIKMPKDPEKIPSEFNGASKGECKDLALKKETIDVIKEGMKEACSLGGTGWPLFDFKVKTDSTSVKDRIDGKNFIDSKEGWVKIPVACKTGTAEFGDSQKRTHAWFTTFAPVENPEIAITILVEKGGEGSNVAAPVAKKILEYYFR
jgi:penicillin-binding protein 2